MPVKQIPKSQPKSAAASQPEYIETVLERKTRGRPRNPTPEPEPEPQGDEAIKLLPKGYMKGYPPAITATEPQKADAIIKRYPKSEAQIKAFQDKVLTPRQEQMKKRIEQREIIAAKALIEKYGEHLGLSGSYAPTPAPTPTPTPESTPTPIILKKVKAPRKPRTIIVEETESDSDLCSGQEWRERRHEDIEVVRRRKPRARKPQQSESEPEYQPPAYQPPTYQPAPQYSSFKPINRNGGSFFV